MTSAGASGREVVDDAKVRPKRFGIRDLRSDTAAVLEEAERAGAAYITRNGEVVAKLVHYREKPEMHTPTTHLLTRVATLARTETGWADEHARRKSAEIGVHRDDPKY